mgnify:CR=1 FL=1
MGKDHHGKTLSVEEKDNLTKILLAFVRWVLQPKDKERKFKYEKMLYLYGAKGSGKGTFLEVIRMLIGEPNCGNISLPNLDNQNMLFSLLGKVVAMCMDHQGHIPDSDILSQLISNESLLVKKLYKDSFSARLGTPVIVASNAYPSFSRECTGMERRIIPIAFNSPPVESDPFLLDTLEKEIPHIFNLVMAHSMEFVDRYLRTADYTASVEQFKLEIELANNPVMQWLEQYPSPTASLEGSWKLSTDSLYKNYLDWCKENGQLHPGNTAVFGKRLGELGCQPYRTKNDRGWDLGMRIK